MNSITFTSWLLLFLGKKGGLFIKEKEKKLVYINQICPRDTFEKCSVTRTKGHSHGVPIHKKSHTYFQNTKYGQSVNASKKLTCVLPFFMRPSATNFASPYMWCRWTTYSLLRSILQLEVMKNNFGAKFLEEVRHVRTKVESTLTLKNLIPMSQAVIKPCLTAHNSALLLEAIQMWQEKPTTYFLKWSRITPLILWYWVSLTSWHPFLVMQKEKGGIAIQYISHTYMF